MEKSALTEALAAVQAALPEVRKGQKADAGQYSYSYADLAQITKAIMPLLAQNGLAWVCRPTFSGDRFVLAYELRHTSGESIVGEYPLVGNTPQQIGSAVSYARRYCLCSVTGVAPESDDDDAQAARHHEVIPTRRRQVAPEAGPEPAPEASPTDEQVERFGEFRLQIAGSTRVGLDALVPEIKAAYEQGQITGRQNHRLRDLWQQRAAALEAKATAAADEPDGEVALDAG